jgi:hypothetical protein
MVTDKPMSEEEDIAIRLRAAKLWNEGKREEAEALSRTAPIFPEQAKVIKKYFGLDALKALDLNLSNAVVKYGPDFLTK